MSIEPTGPITNIPYVGSKSQSFLQYEIEYENMDSNSREDPIYPILSKVNQGKQDNNNTTGWLIY